MPVRGWKGSRRLPPGICHGQHAGLLEFREAGRNCYIEEIQCDRPFTMSLIMAPMKAAQQQALRRRRTWYGREHVSAHDDPRGFV